MKKHLFTVTALALALVCSAFSKSRTTTQKQGFEDAALIWYLVDGSGHVDPNNPMNPGDPMTAGEFLSTFYPLCSSGTEADCVRGFASQTPPSSITDAGIEQIKKDL
jgi:hypothetical protein